MLMAVAHMNPSQQLKFGGIAMSTRHLTFNLRKHRKYLAHADIQFSSLQSREPQRNPRGTHPLPRAASSNPCHPSNVAGPQLRSACHCGPPAPSRVPIASVLRAPSSDPRATLPARRVPFLQERTPNLTVWGKKKNIYIYICKRER